MKSKQLELRAALLLSLFCIGAAAGLNGCAVVAVGGAGAAVASDRRSAGSMLDDQSIELQIHDAFNKDEQLFDKVHINVTSYDGIVLLTGEAPSAAQRERAVHHARNIDKVRRVHDEITVAPPSSMLSRSQDTWITTKVKTQLLSNKKVAAHHIKVVTENGSVYLMGIVTRAEGEAATETARYVDGVARVVTIFEYRD